VITGIKCDKQIQQEDETQASKREIALFFKLHLFSTQQEDIIYINSVPFTLISKHHNSRLLRQTGIFDGRRTDENRGLNTFTTPFCI
jgi:hypothetical protein